MALQMTDCYECARAKHVICLRTSVHLRSPSHFGFCVFCGFWLIGGRCGMPVCGSSIKSRKRDVLKHKFSM